MHYSHFSDRIYVEKTSEQCCLGYHNSQKAERGVDETDTQVKTQMINKCRMKMIQKELYNVRDLP